MIDYEQIEQYCLGQLSLQEKKEFENNVAQDSALAEALKDYQSSILPLAHHVKSEAALHQLKQTLKTSEEFYFKDTRASTFSLKTIVRISLSAAAMLLIGLWLFYPQPDLYDKYANHEPIYVQTKGTSSSLSQGVNAFNKGNYSEAIAPLKIYLKEHPNDLEIRMALGIAYLETEELASAKEIFSDKELLQSVFRNKTIWYSALTYLKMQDNTACSQELRLLIDDSFYGEKAKQLLNELASE